MEEQEDKPKSRVVLITDKMTLAPDISSKDKVLSEFEDDVLEAPRKLYVTKASYSTRERFVGIMALFANGKEAQYTPKGARYSYGGDSKLYWCPNCHYPLDPRWRTGGISICERCNVSHDIKDLIGEYCYDCAWEKFLDHFMQVYNRIMDCDIYVARNICSAPVDQRLTGKGLMDLERNVKEGPRVVYPFTSILADIQHKADMRKRFSDFLRSA